MPFSCFVRFLSFAFFLRWFFLSSKNGSWLGRWGAWATFDNWSSGSICSWLSSQTWRGSKLRESRASISKPVLILLLDDSILFHVQMIRILCSLNAGLLGWSLESSVWNTKLSVRSINSIDRSIEVSFWQDKSSSQSIGSLSWAVDSFTKFMWLSTWSIVSQWDRLPCRLFGFSAGLDRFQKERIRCFEIRHEEGRSQTRLKAKSKLEKIQVWTRHAEMRSWKKKEIARQFL